MALAQPQHVFLQALMARSVMREDTARSMHVEITGADPAQDPRAFDRFWGEIARAIGFLDLDLRRVKWPEDGQLYVGVVNKRAGETAKLATRLTAEQIALFRMVLDEILRDDHNAEHGVDVIRVGQRHPAVVAERQPQARVRLRPTGRFRRRRRRAWRR